MKKLINNLRSKPPVMEDCLAAADKLEGMQKALELITLTESVYAARKIASIALGMYIDREDMK